jgi:CBS domain-containing protein
MTTELYTVGPAADVMTALEEMDEHGVGRLVVMADDTFAGIVTRTDIMTALSIIKSSSRYQSEPARTEGAEVLNTEEFRRS